MQHTNDHMQMSQVLLRSAPTTVNQMSDVTSLSINPYVANLSSSFDERMQCQADDPMQVSVTQFYNVQTQMGKQGERLSRPQYRMWLNKNYASAYII